jgi:hypothetical protein
MTEKEETSIPHTVSLWTILQKVDTGKYCTKTGHDIAELCGHTRGSSGLKLLGSTGCGW